ncbi:MAG TPA: hypothetical protein VJ577_13860 [Burkholderiaceae bacterium]|nr:hypothetical protein [Burkholderiaceae bacterium]
MHATGQPADDAFILGDRILHVRFLAAIRLLVCMMRAMPHAIAASGLAQDIEQPLRLVRALLRRLHQSGLIVPGGATRETWRCAQDLRAVTFADVFRSISVSRAGAAASGMEERGARASSAQQNVDLLLMQVTMTINRVALQQLQQFDLGRLMMVTAPNPSGTPPYGIPYLAKPGRAA